MRDGIDHAAVDEAESRRRKAGRDAIAIAAIDIEVQRRAAVARRALFVDKRGGDHSLPVARRQANPFGYLLRRIVTRRNRLHLRRLQGPASAGIGLKARKSTRWTSTHK